MVKLAIDLRVFDVLAQEQKIELTTLAATRGADLKLICKASCRQPELYKTDEDHRSCYALFGCYGACHRDRLKSMGAQTTSKSLRKWLSAC